MVTPQSTVQRASGHVATTMGERIVAMSLSAGKYFSIEGTAKDIWAMTETPVSVSSIVDRMTEDYEVGRETCETDVLAFLNALHSDNLIEIVG